MNYRVLIIAPVSTDKYNQRILDAVRGVTPPDIHVDIKNIGPGGHDCIENRWDLARNVPGVVKLAAEAERDGYNGIFVTDFDMCGVEACREVVDIPVLGAFVPCAFTALSLSQRFSIVTVLGSTAGMQFDHIRNYGLTEGFASIRAVNLSVAELSDIQKVIAAVYETGLKAIQQDHAQSLLLGCTGFVGVAGPVQTALERTLSAFVPVIDPNQAAFGFLLSLLRAQLRPSRLCYSKVQVHG
jgi:Asp/Glu/hydantoin racemase